MTHEPEVPGEPQKSPRSIDSDPVLEGLRGLLATMIERPTVWVFKKFGARALGRSQGVESDILDDPRKIGGERQAPDPDTLFLAHPLSGEEAQACMIDLLSGLPWSVTQRIREYCELPAAERYTVDPDSYGANLTHREITTMAIALGGSIRHAQKAIHKRRPVTVEHCMPADKEIHVLAGALGSVHDFRGSTIEERKQYLTWAYCQLPHLMRESFEQQQAVKEQLGHNTDQL